MDFEEIKQHVKDKKYLVSIHAEEELVKDGLTTKDVEEAILSGEVIEERPKDPRGESRLVVGESSTGKCIHVVVGLRVGMPVIVTTYLPEEEEWEYGKIRKRRKL